MVSSSSSSSSDSLTLILVWPYRWQCSLPLRRAPRHPLPSSWPAPVGQGASAHPQEAGQNDNDKNGKTDPMTRTNRNSSCSFEACDFRISNPRTMACLDLDVCFWTQSLVVWLIHERQDKTMMIAKTNPIRHQRRTRWHNKPAKWHRTITKTDSVTTKLPDNSWAKYYFTKCLSQGMPAARCDNKNRTLNHIMIWRIIMLYHIISYRTAPHGTAPRRILSCPILSYPVLSRPIPSYPVLSCSSIAWHGTARHSIMTHIGVTKDKRRSRREVGRQPGTCRVSTWQAGRPLAGRR